MSAEGAHLLELLNELFEQDPDIDELGFVLSAHPTNFTGEGTTPKIKFSGNTHNEEEERKYPYYCRDHKLGLAFWCLAILYKYAFTTFNSLRSTVSFSALDETQAKLLLELTRAILLINADAYTAWNVRKNLITSGKLGLRVEIKFLNLVYTKHPKSGEAWAHRRWVLERVFASSDIATSLSEYCAVELQVCRRVAEIYPKNYYAWTHRMWVIDRISSLSIAPPSSASTSAFQPLISARDLLLGDLSAMDEWTRKNISDHCGYHHRQVILLGLIACVAQRPHCRQWHALYGANYGTAVLFGERQRCAENVHAHTEPSRNIPEEVARAFLHEFAYVSKMLAIFPGHEALWCHRRFLIWAWLLLTAGRPSAVGPFTLSSSECSDEQTRELPSVTLSSERRFVEEVIAEQDAAHYADQRRFAAAYHVWLLELEARIACAAALGGRAVDNQLVPRGIDDVRREQHTVLEQLKVWGPFPSIWRELQGALPHSGES